ncbi:hypothetical protein E4631_23945 [Hymenobacter sp. UV11]|uniref:hypothetical protein n=1 Tax=Hymenobacter sp. UV11 TaxID=1849735 RepID=UPI00105DD89F|nr:hypothetical protein [Hymenobacter sp. UV11]TDN38588.1 hypothetical protein A8B98_22855 [Hymenobacter sp. UV11]TFZ62983.1 hypothetical protein E4631_23945 [Hymenobacter sp. UV11]
MSTKKKVTAPVVVEPTNEAAIIATENAIEAFVETTEDATTEEAFELAVEKAKRNRSYSQTAINTDDLERLNQFKAHIKETRNINVSNQVILAAAIEALSANMEAFLNTLVTTATDKQRAKDLKAFEALKAKLALTDEAQVSTSEAA